MSPKNKSKPEDYLHKGLNRVPRDLHHVYLMGICGTGMASLAGILREQGFSLTGSDQNIYPPMSDFLESLSIPVLEGYSAEHLYPSPDLVIVGNVITRDNPEAVELSHLGLPYLSFPQAIKTFAIRDKRSIVVSGTHGKTTTSSLIAWLLEKAGLDPGFMIGGIPQNFHKNFKEGKGPYFVIEGDEYDTAFFDKGPKFLHYNPWVTILTSIEFDHADIYRDLDHVIDSFNKLIDLIPPDGLLIANGDIPTIRPIIERAKCRVVTYSLSDNGQWRAADITPQGDLTCLKIFNAGEEKSHLCTGLYGNHNLSNLLSAVVLADFLGLPRHVVSEAVKDFQGVVRRQQIIGEKKGILVLDDFAHHPTSVRETVAAVSKKYKGRRLIAVFEPRSNSSRRNVFQTLYASSFDDADVIMIPEPQLMEKIPVSERFSSQSLVKDLINRGLMALYFENTDRLLEGLLKEIQDGDVVLFMSNGVFDYLPRKLLKRLDTI